MDDDRDKLETILAMARAIVKLARQVGDGELADAAMALEKMAADKLRH
jgi:hypothetical protein